MLLVSLKTKQKSIMSASNINSHLHPVSYPPQLNATPSSSFNHYPSAAFNDITTNITDTTLLFEKLICLPNQESSIKELNEAIENYDINHKILLNPDYPYYGLLALKNGQFSPEQFSTLMFFWAATQAHFREDVKVVSLFDSNGSVNLQAMEIITNTLIPWNSTTSDNLNIKFYLTPSELDHFFEKIKQYPKSGAQFFITPDREGCGVEKNAKINLVKFLMRERTVTQQIAISTGINIFGRFVSEENTPSRMVASFEMRQAFLTSKFGNAAVSLHPIIGLSPKEAIEKNGLTNTREMALPFPNVFYPNEADNYPLGEPLDFVDHDFYHAFIASHIPSEHQKAFVKTAGIFKEFALKPQYKSVSKVLLEMHEHLIDMEHGVYRTSTPLRKSNTFFQVISEVYSAAIARLNVKTPLDREGLDPKTIYKIYSSNYINRIQKTNVRLADTEVITEIAKVIIGKREELEALGISFGELDEWVIVTLKDLPNWCEPLSPVEAEKIDLIMQLEHEYFQSTFPLSTSWCNIL